jgi:hypothetical protein
MDPASRITGTIEVLGYLTLSVREFRVPGRDLIKLRLNKPGLDVLLYRS